MRKKTSINYEVVKNLFDLTPDLGPQESYFRINGGPEPIIVPIPVSIIHRLFRLGQAYNIRELRFLESDVKFIIGSTEVQGFINDLARLKTLVNDEVLHHYADQILSALNAEPGPKGKHVAVSTGGF